MIEFNYEDLRCYSLEISKTKNPGKKIVLRFYRKVLQGYSFSIILSDSEGDFNVARARNMGVARAIQESADVIIIGDADTIPEKTQSWKVSPRLLRILNVYFPFPNTDLSLIYRL